MAENRLLLIDTFSGEIATLAEGDVPRALSRPIWNSDGTQLAYNDRLDTVIIDPFLMDAPAYFPYMSRIGFFSIEDWSPDGNSLLGIGGDTDHYTVSTFNLLDETYTILREYIVGEPLPENSDLQFREIKNLSWNPAFSDWIMIEIEAVQIATLDLIEPTFLTVLVAFNHATGEPHLINDLIAGLPEYLPDLAWSADGQEIIFATETGGSRIDIPPLLDSSGHWNPQPSLGANELFRTTLLGWLGVERLFLLRRLNQDETQYIYEIGKIVGDEILTLPFFTLDRMDIGDISGSGTWHLNADTAEQAQISTLFD
ncbi:MAG: hypothetical protein RLP44_32390 [Aggregatilineales bacterium]